MTLLNLALLAEAKPLWRSALVLVFGVLLYKVLFGTKTEKEELKEGAQLVGKVLYWLLAVGAAFALYNMQFGE